MFFCSNCQLGNHEHDDADCKAEWTDSICDCQAPRGDFRIAEVRFTFNVHDIAGRVVASEERSKFLALLSEYIGDYSYYQLKTFIRERL